MRFKLSVIGLAILASNIAMAGSLTLDDSQADSFMVTYQNNTKHSYSYSNNLQRDSSKSGFEQLGNWQGSGKLATKEKITFSGILDKDKAKGGKHWVKFMLKNNDTGQEYVFELENPANSATGPKLHYYEIARGKVSESTWDEVVKQNGHYIINIGFRTNKHSGLDSPLVNENIAAIRALNPQYATRNDCYIWEEFGFACS
jgi:hypothetical protein